MKKVYILSIVLIALVGCAVTSWTGYSAIKFDGTQYPEITFGNAETISNTTDGTLDFGAANLTTTGKLTSTGAVYYASLNYGGVSDNTPATDSLAITMSNAPAAYATGMLVLFKADTANAGAFAVNVNALGWKAVKVRNNAVPDTNYVEAGSMVLMSYDGTNFQLLEPDANP